MSGALGYIPHMARLETPAARIDRLLESGDAVGALLAADQFLAKAPNSFLGRLGRCRANIRLRNYIDAETDLALALSLAPRDESANLIRATLDQRLGRTDEAIERFRAIAGGRSVHAPEAAFALAELYFNAGRRAEVAAMVAAGGAWLKDPRAAMSVARVRTDEDFDAGMDVYRAILRGRDPAILRRLAGFEAAGRLDKAGRYREAFEWATETHRTTGQIVEVESWLQPLQERRATLQKASEICKPRVPKVEGVAIVAAMPRSGTTLVEMMLDRHPSIGGIGEFDGLTSIQHALGGLPMWPRVPSATPASLLEAEQTRYVRGAQQIRKAGASWTFDKSLLAWQVLVEIAVTLPGAVLINVERDPRDLAISQYMSFLNPIAYGWTSRLESIRRMIAFEREFVPEALTALGGEHGVLSYESFAYEDLVEDPAFFAHRCLTRMSLSMDDRVLSPEQSSRGAATLSSQQVKRPINRSSIGRWKNYEWAFDDSWRTLADAHDARRSRG